MEITENEVELFQPFKPMLCTRLTKLKGDDDDENGDGIGLKSISRKDIAGLPPPPFLVETKCDGERFQIHYDSTRPPHDQFRYFSRQIIVSN